MARLFSRFDPASFLGLPINWLSVLLVILVLPSSFWVSPNQVGSLITQVTHLVKKEFIASMSPNSVPGLLLVSLGLWLIITLNNSIGLMPYIFTASRHLSFTLSLALPMWVGHIVIGFYSTPQLRLAHLVPLGTPTALIPFMFLVEVVSRVIRPLTLSVRLAANITAGHLLLALLTGPSYSVSSVILICIIVALILLIMLESAVRLIQAYVFSVLSTLYLNEVNSVSIS